MEVSSELHVAPALPMGKEPLVPIGWQTGWVLESVWVFRRREEPCTT
jgi:hypothetical protein